MTMDRFIRLGIVATAFVLAYLYLDWVVALAWDLSTIIIKL